MTDTLVRRVRNLQEARNLADIDDVVYERALAKLRIQYGAAALTEALATLSTTITDQDIHNTLSNQGAQGIFHGSVDTSEHTALAPLFAGHATGNYIAKVINLYHHHTTTPTIDYGAALRRYLEHLYRRHATIDLRGIDDRPMDLRLNELYVSLSLHEPPPDALRGRGRLRSFLEQMRKHVPLFDPASTADREDAAPMENLISGSVDVKALSWEDVMCFERIAVVGAPGSGKTTLLQYTAVRLVEALAQDDTHLVRQLGLSKRLVGRQPPIPIFMPLRELGAYLSVANQRETLGANPNLLVHCINHYYAGFDLDLPPDFFQQLCESGQALLLLDGLDEVSSSADRVLVSSIVREFATRYHRCRYMLTTRVAAYQGDAQIGADFRICTVADLTPQQQHQFIRNWSRSLHRLVYLLDGSALEQAADQYAHQLWTALKANPRVRELASNPLLLTVVAVIYYNNCVLPEDRASLYEECVEVLLRGGRGKVDRAAQDRMHYSGQSAVRMGLNSRRELLAAVAYHMHQRGEAGLTISRQELTALIATSIATDTDTQTAARSFVQELPVHLGLLDEREPDQFRFSHLSFQEFLAARYIAESASWDALLPQYQDTWWREVILLCAGYLSKERCWRFLLALIHQTMTEDDRIMALELVATALSELERFKGQSPMKEPVLQELVTVLQSARSTVTPAMRLACSRALAQLGDPRPDITNLPPRLTHLSGGETIIGLRPDEAPGLQSDPAGTYRHQNDDVVKQFSDIIAKTCNQTPCVLPPYEMGCYPITNAQYQCFMDAEGYNLDAPWWDDAGRAWLYRADHTLTTVAQWRRRRQKNRPEWWDDERFGIARPNHPVVGLSWYEAIAFCRWLTQHRAYNPMGYVYTLPSEAEWEFAARAGKRWRYPWGFQAPTSSYANFASIYHGTTAVGCFPQGATPAGLSDMVGNSWEWTRSNYRPYPYDPAEDQPDLIAAPQPLYVIRGGAWNNQVLFLNAALRFPTHPDTLNYIGFRVVRYPPSGIHASQP